MPRIEKAREACPRIAAYAAAARAINDSKKHPKNTKSRILIVYSVV